MNILMNKKETWTEVILQKSSNWKPLTVNKDRDPSHYRFSYFVFIVRRIQYRDTSLEVCLTIYWWLQNHYIALLSVWGIVRYSVIPNPSMHAWDSLCEHVRGGRYGKNIKNKWNSGMITIHGLIRILFHVFICPSVFGSAFSLFNEIVPDFSIVHWNACFTCILN